MRRASKLKIKRTMHSFGVIVILAIVAVLVVGFALAQNNIVIPRNYVYQSERIPKTFVGYTIAHISDVANKPMMTAQVVGSQNPDLVVITGNFSDNNGEYNNSVKLVQSLSDDYDVLYVLGESDKDVKEALTSALDSAGGINIENKAIDIPSPQVDADDFISEFIGDQFVRLADSGDEDAKAYLDYTRASLTEDANSKLIVSGLGLMGDDTDFLDYIYGIISLDKDIFQIVAMNQSQYFNEVSLADIDMVLAGNTFGIDRFSNSQTSGLYSKNGTAMFLSSGIGKNPNDNLRILNFPSVGIITLSDGTISDDNPLERFLGIFITDVKTRFDGDAGFKVYRYDY